MFAGSIAALLLSAPALAAACDLTCAFPSMSADCHSQQTGAQDSAAGGMKMDGMAMAGMLMPEVAGSENQQADSVAARVNANHASIGAMGPCERQACDNGSAVSAKTTRSVDPNSHSLPAFMENPRADDALTLLHDARDDVAMFQVRDGNAFHPSLRI